MTHNFSHKPVVSVVCAFQLYRLEDLEGSMQLYREVVKNSQDDYDDERQTNVSAVAAALSLSGSTSDLVFKCCCHRLH